MQADWFCYCYMQPFIIVGDICNQLCISCCDNDLQYCIYLFVVRPLHILIDWFSLLIVQYVSTACIQYIYFTLYIYPNMHIL